MKKILLISGICLSLSTIAFGQKLAKKEATKILDKAWSAVKANDTSAFIKLWLLDEMQWPYHAGKKFTSEEVKTNFYDFKSYFSEPLAKGSKFDAVECDTISHDDPHFDFAKYYIRAWFKLADNSRKGFGFYMFNSGDKWLIRFSPDYSNEPAKK